MHGPALGSVPDETGVSFGIFSAHATAIDLCLFDDDGRREIRRIALSAAADGLWSVHVAGVRDGQLYGYRAHGPYDPASGQRFNANKLLVDPYARRLAGTLVYDDAIYGYRRQDGTGDTASFDNRDSAPFVPKSVVVAGPPAADLVHERPHRPWGETILHEAHVRGLTKLHPGIPEPLRGTYEALGHPAIIAHLLGLGVTAIELLPVHEIADEPAIVGRGLVNYWGYSTLGYFAPASRYLGPSGHDGLKQAIRALHAVGIEVILDVVYNHTAEGEEDGPTLSFRGLDSASYYKAEPGNPGRLWNVTGCGNTLDVGHPRVRQLVIASLRHWAEVYGVDGFRFDLATALARDRSDFEAGSAFFDAVAADPVLGRLKMIAEPWDVGDGGYRLGGFPAGWSEWNDRFRDTIRAFWRGDRNVLPRLTQGLTGSKEIFAASGRTVRASINYVTSHDGFTLRDLVSYEHKHNEANGEGNRDGHGDNLSANHGTEGDTADAAIRAARARSVRAMLATILLAQGVPMLLAGDELARSQDGNNNPYCQDNATTWLDWGAGQDLDPDLPEFVAGLTALRRRYPGLRREGFLTGEIVPGTGLQDVYWVAPSGSMMKSEDWADASRQVIGMQIGNEGAPDHRLLLLFNGSTDRVAFRLPDDLPGRAWRPMFDSSRPTGCVDGGADLLQRAGTFALEPRSVVLLQHEP